MSENESNSLRSELFKDHPSISGPFPVANLWMRLFGILTPYFLLYVLVILGYMPVAIALIPLVSIIRPLVSSYLGSSLFESFVQIKVIDKKSMSKPKLSKFFVREICIFVSVIISLLLGAGFVLFVSLFAQLSHSPEGFNTLYAICAAMFLVLPFLYTWFDKDEQTLFDKMAGVHVISTAPHFKITYPVTFSYIEPDATTKSS